MHAYRHHANIVESVTTLNNSLYANVLKIMKDPRALVGITTNNSTKYIFHFPQKHSWKIVCTRGSVCTRAHIHFIIKRSIISYCCTRDDSVMNITMTTIRPSVFCRPQRLQVYSMHERSYMQYTSRTLYMHMQGALRGAKLRTWVFRDNIIIPSYIGVWANRHFC